MTSELDAQKHRLFKINGRNILIRGGGWTQDLMLRVDDEREDQELRYAQEMNLNTVRLEGKMMNEHFYQACDRRGILVMAGWCCCSYWERWKKCPEAGVTIRRRREALRDNQIRRLREPSQRKLHFFSMAAIIRRSGKRPKTMYLESAEGRALAEPVYIVGCGREHAGRRSYRRENERTLRVCRAQLLAAGS